MPLPYLCYMMILQLVTLSVAGTMELDAHACYVRRASREAIIAMSEGATTSTYPHVIVDQPDEHVGL